MHRLSLKLERTSFFKIHLKKRSLPCRQITEEQPISNSALCLPIKNQRQSVQQEVFGERIGGKGKQPISTELRHLSQLKFPADERQTYPIKIHRQGARGVHVRNKRQRRREGGQSCVLIKTTRKPLYVLANVSPITRNNSWPKQNELAGHADPKARASNSPENNNPLTSVERPAGG